MCNVCLKRALSHEIVEAQAKIENVFKKIDGNPNLKHDQEFSNLLNCMGDLLDKYSEIK